MNKSAPAYLVFPGRNYFSVRSRLRLLPIWCLLFTSFFFYPFMESRAQYAFTPDNDETLSAYDELLVTTYLDSNWSFNIHMIITNDNLLYINMEDLFRNLDIPCTVNEGGNKMEGSIDYESNLYTVDFNAKQIKIGAKLFQVQKELVKESGSMYLESNAMAKFFGLNFTFNPRSLSAKLVADFELPKAKQKRLEKTRTNVSKLRGELSTADTVIRRDYHIFKFGNMNWGFALDQTMNQDAHNSMSLGVGGELLYGEVNVSANYDDRYKIDNRQLNYSWRWVDNDKTFIKQAQVGNLYNQSIATLNFPVVGATIRNSPTTIRRAAGYYTITENTEPNWTIELYINDILVNYTTADASGLFVFTVPVVYGYTTLKLKFYGPMGEERTEERTMNVPFTFMPANTFEYGLSGGFLEDGNNSRYGHGEFNYGVNRFLTLSGGVEYLSSIPNNPYIPFAKVALLPFSKMILNFEYARHVRWQSLLNYYFTPNVLFELDYAKYVKGQLATQFNANEEIKAKISFPLRIKKLTGYTKLNFNQNAYQSFTYNLIDLTLSVNYKQFSVNSSSMLNWVNKNPVYGTTDLSLSYKIRNGLVVRPSAQYNLTTKNPVYVKAELEKRVSKAYFSISYERNMAAHIDNLYVSFRYDLPFMRTNLTSSYSNNSFRFSESAQGSVAFGGDNHYVKTGFNSALGKGGILFYPFLDRNNNGIMDPGEKMILVSQVQVIGGSAEISKKDSIVRVSDLNAFVDYNVEFSDQDLDNVAWRFKFKKFRVLVDPNQYKRVFVPVIAVGEVSGNTYVAKNDTVEGLGRILVQFYPKNSKKKVAETLSESDGYTYYLGLAPGAYVARIDSTQLSNLHFVSDPPQFDFTIKTVEQGDVVEGMNFTLRSTLPEVRDSSQKKPAVSPVKNLEVKAEEPIDTTESEPVKSYENQTNTIEKELTYLQVGAFKWQINASKMAESLQATLHDPVEVFPDNGWFKVRVGGFITREETNRCRTALIAKKNLAANQIMEIHLTKSENEPAISMPVAAKKNRILTNGNAATPTQTKPASPEIRVIAQQKNVVRPVSPQMGKVASPTAAQTEGSTKQNISTDVEPALKQYYFVQVAAFKYPRYATRMIRNLSRMINNTVGIVYRDAYYKVRYGPFETVPELNECLEKIVSSGVLRRDQLKIEHEEIGLVLAADVPHLADGYNIQVGAFGKKANAIIYYKKLTAEYPFPLMMVEEDGYYKIRFGPFKALSDLKKCQQALAKNKVNFLTRSNRIQYF